MNPHIEPAIIYDELEPIFDYFRLQSLQWCILKSRFEFERSLKSGQVSDIDLYVSFSSLKKIEFQLERLGWTKVLTFRHQHSRLHFHKIIYGYKVKLDIARNPSIFIGNYEYALKEDCLAFNQFDGVFFLQDDVATWFIVMKSIIFNHLPISKEKQEILNFLSNEMTFEELSAIASEKFTCAKKARISLVAFALCYLKKLRPLIGRRCVAFVGLDGAGKGLYISKLQEDLKRANLESKCVYLGHSNYKLSVVAKIVEWRQNHSKSTLDKILQTFYLLLFPFELIRRRGIGAVDIIVCDRHPLVEPVFGRKRIFKLYDKVLAKISPCPSQIIYLTGNDLVLWERKKESPLHEFVVKSAELNKKIESLQTRFDILTIDTQGGIEESYVKIISSIKL